MADIATLAIWADWAVTAVLAVLAMLVGRGLLPILARPDGSAVWHLAMSAALFATGAGARALYWSAAPLELRQAIGKAPANLVFGLVLIAASYHFLRLLYLTIPEADRGNYTLLTAPFYPRGLSMARRLEAMLRPWRR